MNAQQPGDFSKNWKAVEAFEKKGLTKSALKEAISIFEQAVATGNEVQQVKSAMYQMKYRNMVEEDNLEKNIFYLDTLIARTKAPAKNILQSMQAELFQHFRDENRYKFYDRTGLREEKSNDINTWSIEKLNTTIANMYKLSLKNDGQLKSISLNNYDAIIQKGEHTRQLRPTLYDLLAHRALDYFRNDENDITQPSYKFILNDERIFLPAPDFCKIKFSTKDSLSLHYHALLLFQEILKFHSVDSNPEALLDADLDRLAFMNEYGVFTNKDRLYENALLQLEVMYGQFPVVAQAMYLRASLYQSKGSAYDPFSNKDCQFETRRSKELCDLVISKYPNTEGAINCKNLLNEITKPSLNLETEKVNVPDQPFRSLVTFKNINTLYFRIIRSNREEIRKLNQTVYDDKWKQLLELKPYNTFSVELPDLRDFQQHNTEMKTDGLPAGTYLVLASIKADFDPDQNIIARQVIYISNISYILNNKNEMYILHRDNGSPLKNAEVQLWQQKYNYDNRKYEEIKTDKYNSDQNGLVRIKTAKDSYNNAIQVKYNNEELFLDDNISTQYYNSYEKKTAKNTFLFTDRSIYRPGQTIYFKGIVVSTDSSGRKNEIVAGWKTTVLLLDVNGQKTGSLNLVTNDYGSYNGSFKLPEGQMNGQFHLQDTTTRSYQYFSVEEYKRPKFFVEISKPAGTYRLNDSITIKGNAKAFAGNNIDGAKVSYRVTRKTQYPAWWGWSGSRNYRKTIFPFSREEMEISNGETVTDANGEFALSFKAIPDEKTDKKYQPVFNYEISADITDINGETHSGNTYVAVAYQSLMLSIIAPDKLQADSIKTIKIKSTNLNSIFEKANVNISIYKLKSPGRLFRDRYWTAPDMFIMSKEAFYKDFPYDAYNDEDMVSNWPVADKVFDKTDTTRANADWSFTQGQFITGWFKMIAVTKDKYGEEVKAEKYFQLTDANGYTTENTEEVSLDIKKEIFQPGEKINYSLSTGLGKIWMIHNLEKMNKAVSMSYLDITANKPFINEIDVTEEDRGGISMNYAFVKHNRVYSNSRVFAVPWNNKDLKISFETFRDKLLPGSEEKWKIRISGEKKEKLAAEALLSMYDESLDQFRPHSWNSLSSVWPGFTNQTYWRQGGFAAVNSDVLNRMNFPWVNPWPKSYDGLQDNGWNRVYGYAYDGIRMAAPAMNNVQLNEVIVTKSVERDIAARGQGRKSNKESGDVNADTSSVKQKENSNQEDAVQIRKNFNETAFFFPALMTDPEGNIEFSFTIPEALTKWKLLAFAHSKDLASGISSQSVITQKPLMLQPNAPRFLRENDQLEFTSKLVNLSEKELSGNVQLELFDAATNKAVDGWFKNIFPVQFFTVKPGQSFLVRFPIGIPSNFNSALSWRLKAITSNKDFSDGEESVLPVLTNRMLVTESLPLNLRNTNTKNFKFEKLLNSGNSPTLSNHALTVEYSSNPAWYALQALPYLMEYPYECAEQEFNRYYANALAAFIANSSSRVKEIFEKWQHADTAALLSNLQKNEELKSVLLQETPWVLDAKDEQQQKKNIALLFDLVRMAKEKNSAFSKLKEMQTSNGGFPWFKGGPDDRYITQYILTGIGHLLKLKALGPDDYNKLKPVIEKALPYLDARIKEDYDNLIRYKANLKKNNLSAVAIQYLYMRSFFRDYKVSSTAQVAYTYYREQSKKFWLANGKYMQAMIALALNRTDENKIPAAIIRSLRENAILNEEMGMYWRDLATGGYYWYQAPIESQAMMIEAFTDIDKNNKTIDDLKTWLLKNKQTRNWKTTKATAEACYALLLNGSNWLTEEKTVEIKLGRTEISSSDSSTEAGTGYFKKTFDAGKISPDMGNISLTVASKNNQQVTSSTSWGSVYWQYFEDLDKITPAETPLKLVKKLFIEKNSDRGPVLAALNEGEALHVGDKIKVRIELRSDRDMEYVHMKDMRAACMEPVNVLSSYKWQGGLGYYESTKDASTNFFFHWLPRGTYVFEYPLFVTHTGNFSNGVTTIQCMYAPEFTSHSEGLRVNIE